jgi:hypothetical protein
MAFPTSTTDILATTIEKRSRKIRDNITKNNALLTQMDKKGRIQLVSGGSSIVEELSFAENGNAAFYSGYDLIQTAQQDVISAAQFTLKQAAVPVVVSGLEELQNSGEEAQIDLLEARLGVAEGTMANLLSIGLYGDGTAYSGKSITGLDAAVESTVTASQSSTYGGISRTTWSFWRNYSTGAITLPTAANIQATLNTAWASVTRGQDRPDMLIMDNNYWTIYLASLQAIQRFTSAETGNAGFQTVKYMDADVYLDGGIGGGAYTASTTGGSCYLLNTKYLKYRPHAKRNIVPLSPNKRYAINQDAEVQIIAWAGNLTCSGARFQGRIQTT